MDKQDLLIEVGQHFVSSFRGLTMTKEFIEQVKRSKIGNYIVFSDNVSSIHDLNKLCIEIDNLIYGETGYHPLITIDQEGGMVSRLPETSAVIPGQMALAALRDEDTIAECSYRNGLMLKKIGCNFNLSPAVDVNNNSLNPVIGVRSFGDDFARVGEYGLSSVKGYMKSGILTCVKHFPGHGNTSTDSHLSLPVIDIAEEEFDLQLLPFKRAIEYGVPAVMTSHILFPRVEKNNLPCTMSRILLTDILRGKLGFDGLIISDCMEMQAIDHFYGTEQGCIESIKAGADIVFVSHNADRAENIIYKVAQKYEEGYYDESEWRASFERIIEAKKDLKPIDFLDENEDFKDDKVFFDSLAQKSITHVSGEIPSFKNNTVFIAPMAYVTSNISDRLDRISFTAALNSAFDSSSKIDIPADPCDEEIKKVLSSLNASQVVFGSYNGHLQKGQLRLVKAISEKGIPVHLFALRNPYDITKEMKECTASAFACYEFSGRIFSEIIEILKGNGHFSGKLPIKLEA